MQNGFLLAIGVIFWVHGTSAFAIDKGVYGDDDRRDVYDHLNPQQMRLIARSTAAVIDKRLLVKTNDNSYTLQTKTFGVQDQLCLDEAFYSQPVAAHCSSFLVAPDIVMSAGHCFLNGNDCGANTFIFDFSYYSEYDQPDIISPSQIFNCKEILKVKVDDESGEDYAIIRLDRPTEDRDPIPLNRFSDIADGDPVTAIGHPSGLPTKIAGGAKVRYSDNPFWFSTNLDVFHGSSGSPVINDATGRVEGILVRGDIDFKYDYVQGCQRVKRCGDDDCQGEAVTKTSAFYHELNPFLSTTLLSKI